MAAARDPQSNPATVARSISQGVHQRRGVHGQRDLLAVAGGVRGEEARGAVAAQVGDDHTAPLLDEHRRHLVVGVDVVGPAVQEQDGGAVLRAGVDIADVEVTGVDLLDVHPDLPTSRR